VPSRVFNSLKKLEVIDLSMNMIKLLENSSFYKLFNLKELYLNKNGLDMRIEVGSFIQLVSIQTVYVSKSILNGLNKKIFTDLLIEKNKFSNKIILDKIYLKSLDIVSVNESDCNLTIELIRLNLHFNLRTEQDWYNYLVNCDRNVLKNYWIYNKIIK
jgi:Leucine-rich repeat (LRR) protein